MTHPNQKNTDTYSIHSNIIQFRVANKSIINYCYVYVDPITRDAVAIDPAWNPQIIIDALARYEAQLKAVLVTHHHFDHIDLASYLASHFNVNVYISRQEAETYNIKLNNMHLFDADTTIRSGNIPVNTILTPGHTSGSCCFLIDNNLFTGDTLFNEGCGLCIGHGASPYAMFDSLKKIRESIFPDTRIYPGHRYATSLGQTFSEVMKINVYLNIENIDSFVKYRMRTPKTNSFIFK